MSFTVKGSTGKRPTVHFRCDACHARLNAPLAESGTQQGCPHCCAPIVVPGRDEFRSWITEGSGQPEFCRPPVRRRWRLKKSQRETLKVYGMLLSVALVLAGFMFLVSFYPSQSTSPPLTFPNAAPGAPGDFASQAEWNRYYQTPEDRAQLKRDRESLDRQLQDPATADRVRTIVGNRH